MSLEYAESSSSSAFSAVTEQSATPKGVYLMGFSHDGNLLSTVDQSRPNVVWIWSLGDAPTLVSALAHEHAVRQITWHHSSTQLLITTANNALPGVRYWNQHQPPCIVRIPITRSENGRYDVRWVHSEENESSMFWFGSTEDHILGYIAINEEHGAAEFRGLNILGGRVSSGSHSTVMSR